MLSYRTGPKGTHLHQQGSAVNEAGFLPVIRELGRLRFLMTGKQSKGVWQAKHFAEIHLKM